MSEVGVIGVGNAGRPLSLRLVEKGHRLRVYDLDREAMAPLVAAGAEAAVSAAAACRDLTITVLPGPGDVEAAVFGQNGILEGLPAGGVLIDVSGIDPATTGRVKEALQARGGNLVSCTLHASAAPARTIPAGTLSIVAGADRPVLERVLSLLQDLAMTVICVPDPAIPKLMKVAIIMQSVVNDLVAAEVLVWLSRQDIDPRILYHVMQETNSAAGTVYLTRLLSGGLKAGGNIRNTHKDLEIALKIAAEHKLPLPLTSLAEQMLQMGRARGMEFKDPTLALSDLYEAITGEPMPVAEELPREIGPELHEPRVIWLGW